MIALQVAIGVASGILIAFLVIMHQRTVSRAISGAASLVGFALAIGLVIWGISAGGGALHAHWPDLTLSSALITIGGWVGMLIALFLIGAGGYGFILTIRLAMKTSRPVMDDNSGLIWIILAAMVNLGLVSILNWAVASVTPLGPWENSIDHWSRANGYADSASGGSLVLLGLWTLIPPAIARWRNRRDETVPGRSVEPTVAETDA